MDYVKLGTSGLDVSPIAIGAMTYGEPDRGHPVWSLGETDARPLIRHALDAGINFFDTANMYSQGSSEEILGHALHDFANRDASPIPPVAMIGTDNLSASRGTRANSPTD